MPTTDVKEYDESLQETVMDGIINILKPVGLTSYQMVHKVKRITGSRKAGHTGTLDPGAAGVLPVCIGNATKIAGFISDFDKSYRAEITFGLVTDTQDLYGRVLKKGDGSVSASEIEKLLEEFKGTVSQIPPMFSAVRHKGKRLYQLAREGKEIYRDPRQVSIYGLKLVDFISPNKALIDIECSKGTYIRTLCHDIGARSGCGAVMSFLVRIRSGPFELKDAVTIEELEEAADSKTIENYLYPIDYSIKHLEKIRINEKALKYAQNGNPLYSHNLAYIPRNLEAGQLVRIYCRDRFIAVGEVYKNNDEIIIGIKKLFYQRH